MNQIYKNQPASIMPKADDLKLGKATKGLIGSLVFHRSEQECVNQIYKNQLVSIMPRACNLKLGKASSWGWLQS